MKRWKCLLVLIVAVVCAGASALYAQRRAPRPVVRPTKGTAPSAGVVSIGEAKGVRRLQLLDKRVTVEGFYFNESVPMLVEDMDLTLRNAPLPPGSYVALSGPAPEGVVGRRSGLTHIRPESAAASDPPAATAEGL